MFHMLITFVLLVSVSIILSAQPGFKTLLRTILTNSEVIALDFQIKQGVLLAVHYFVVFPLKKISLGKMLVNMSFFS